MNSTYAVLLGADFAAAKRHRVAAIGNNHSLSCSNRRIARPWLVSRDCAVQPNQCQNS